MAMHGHANVMQNGFDGFQRKNGYVVWCRKRKHGGMEGMMMGSVECILRIRNISDRRSGRACYSSCFSCIAAPIHSLCLVVSSCMLLLLFTRLLLTQAMLFNSTAMDAN